ncbi:hypothetical protein PVX_002820 [Plasmodium vivax]|uniref:Uncharacterized protein n=1 Tax=Plasmodium vivax (strain Salvador I) TaxID=126793 RepID=A5KBY0_PLAVS|nr:hypothetical protein PVX_002820 [Plasmodium vivax]EDL43176.1 hypothetical protein PVX_002820 [Plasmodium vivax]|eukprot:XP_001612903.1 hypothetical protein [Plasmodium vivax Sal-1]
MGKTDQVESSPKKGKKEEAGGRDVGKNGREEKDRAIQNYDQHEEHFNMPPCGSPQCEGGSESARNDPQLEAPLGEPRLHGCRSVEGGDEVGTHRDTQSNPQSDSHGGTSSYETPQEGTIEALPNEPPHEGDMNCDEVLSIVNYLVSVEREDFKEECPAGGGSGGGSCYGGDDDARDRAQGEGRRGHSPEGTSTVADSPSASPPKGEKDSCDPNQRDHLAQYDIKYRHIFNSMIDYIFSHPSGHFLQLSSQREGGDRRRLGGSVRGRRRRTSSSGEESSNGCELSWKKCTHSDCTCVREVGPPKRREDAPCVSDHQGEKPTRRGTGVPYHLAELPQGGPQTVQKGQPSGGPPPCDINGRNFSREIVGGEATSEYVNARSNSPSNDPQIVKDQTEKAKSRGRHSNQMDTHKVDTIRARIETLQKGIVSSLSKLRGNPRGGTAGGDPQEGKRNGEDIPTLASKPGEKNMYTFYNLVSHPPLYETPTGWQSGRAYLHAPCERRKRVGRRMNRMMRALLPEGRKTILCCVSTDEDLHVWSHIPFADFSFALGGVPQVGPSCWEAPPDGNPAKRYSPSCYTGRNGRCEGGEDDKDGKTAHIDEPSPIGEPRRADRIQFYFHLREFTRQQYKLNMLGEYLQVKQLTESTRHLGGDSSAGGNYNSAHFTRREVHIKRFELLHRYYIQFLSRFFLEGDTSTEEATLNRLKWHMCGLDRCSSDCVGERQQGGGPSSLEASPVETTEVASSREETSHRRPSLHDRSANLSREMGGSLPGCPSDNAEGKVNPEVGPHPRGGARDGANSIASVTSTPTANTPMSANKTAEARERRLLYRYAKRVGRFLRRSRADDPGKLPLGKMRKIVKSLCEVCAVRYRSFLSHELFRLVFKSSGCRKCVERERRDRPPDLTAREEVPHQAKPPQPAAQRRPVKIILKRNIKLCRDPQLEKHFKLDDSPERSGRNGGVITHRVEEQCKEDPPNRPVMDHPIGSTTAPPSEAPPHPNVPIEEVKKANMIGKKIDQVETRKTKGKCGRDVKGSDEGKKKKRDRQGKTPYDEEVAKKRTRPGKTPNGEEVEKKRKRGKSPPGKYPPADSFKTEEGDQQRKEINPSAYHSNHSGGSTSPSEEQRKQRRFCRKTRKKEGKDRRIYYVYLKGQLGVYLNPQREVIYEGRSLFFKGGDRKRQPLDMHFDEVFSRVFFSKILPTCVDEIRVREVSAGFAQRGGESDGRGRSGSIRSSSSSRGSGQGRRSSGETSTEEGQSLRGRATRWKGTTSKAHKLKRDQVVTLFEILYKNFYKCFSRLNVCSLLGTYGSDCSVGGEGPSQEGGPPDEVSEAGELGEVDEAGEAQNAHYYHTCRGSSPQDFFQSNNKNFIRRVLHHVNNTLGDFSFVQKLLDEYEHVERVCADRIAKAFSDCSDDEVAFREEDRYYNVIRDHFVRIIVPFCERNGG